MWTWVNSLEVAVPTQHPDEFLIPYLIPPQDGLSIPVSPTIEMSDEKEDNFSGPIISLWIPQTGGALGLQCPILHVWSFYYPTHANPQECQALSSNQRMNGRFFSLILGVSIWTLAIKTCSSIESISICYLPHQQTPPPPPHSSKRSFPPYPLMTRSKWRSAWDLGLLLSLLFMAGLLWVAHPAWAGCWPHVLHFLSHNGTCYRTYLQAAGEPFQVQPLSPWTGRAHVRLCRLPARWRLASAPRQRPAVQPWPSKSCRL